MASEKPRWIPVTNTAPERRPDTDYGDGGSPETEEVRFVLGVASDTQSRTFVLSRERLLN